jgi:hypothetical protein
VNSFNANFTYPTGSIVAGPSSGLANENPPKGLLPSGDEANEYLCLPQSGIASNPCNGAAVTPGGVQFYFAGQSCLDENGNGATNVFSGKQFNWIVIYMPATNTCSPTLNGGSFTQYIGTIYMPGANLSVNGGNKAPISGQVIVSTANLSGSAGVSITYNPDTAPTPPAARLIQ